MDKRHSFSRSERVHSSAVNIYSASPKRTHHEQASSLPPKYEYEPGPGQLVRPGSVYDIQGSNGHVQFDDDFSKSYESAPPESGDPFQSSVGATIIDDQIWEKRDRHTVYKIAVRFDSRSWSVYRRFRDFVELNNQVRRRFVSFQLNLPPKRFLRSNFEPDFVSHRRKLLQEYLSNLLQLRAAEQCPAVVKFFRFDDPPSADDDLDASRAYSRDLSKTVSLQSRRLCLANDQLKDVLGELDEANIAKERMQRAFNQLQATSGEREKTLTDKLKFCEEQLASCQERERQLRQEHDHVVEQKRLEREAELKVRKLCQEKQELAVRELLMRYEETQADIKRRIKISLSPLLASTNENDEDDTTENADWSSSVRELENTLSQAEVLMKSYHEHVVEGLQSDIQILKSDLAKNKFRLESAEGDSARWKAEFQKVDNRLKQKMKEAQLDKEEMLSEIHSHKNVNQRVEERYFHHLVLMLKMTMMADPKVHPRKINNIDAKVLYTQARQQSVPVDDWPVWLLSHVRGHM